MGSIIEAQAPHEQKQIKMVGEIEKVVEGRGGGMELQC